MDGKEIPHDNGGISVKNRLSINIIQGIIAVILIAGCGNFMATPIKKILDNPRGYSGRTVRIAGEVTETFSFFFIKYFTVKDRSGEITVITTKPLPQRGSRVSIKGTVQEAFSLGDKQLIVIVEPSEAKAG